MALNKQVININFSQGLDLKTDPWQLSSGRFLILENSVFDKSGRLTKRNGYGALEPLPDKSYTTITSYKGDLIAIGNSLQVYDEKSNIWIDKGYIRTVNFSVKELGRSETGVKTVFSDVSSNLICCSIIKDNDGTLYYQIVDTTSGQILVDLTIIGNPVFGYPIDTAYVYAVGNFFFIPFNYTTGGLYYWYCLTVSAQTLISSQQGNNTGYKLLASNVGSGSYFSGCVANNYLYFVYTFAPNGYMNFQTLSSSIVLSTSVPINVTPLAGSLTSQDVIKMCADVSGQQPIIWINYIAFNSSTSSNNLFTSAYNSALIQVLAPTAITDTLAVVSNIKQFTSSVDRNQNFIFFEIADTYDGTIVSNYICVFSIYVTGQALSAGRVIAYGLALASNAFVVPNIIVEPLSGFPLELGYVQYKVFVAAYFQNDPQKTLFILDYLGDVLAKLAYGNFFPNSLLPVVPVIGNNAYCPYLFQYQTNGLVSQANLALINYSTSEVPSYEIANCLHITSGILWMYDGTFPVELGFHLYPDYVKVVTATTGGSITQGTYTYYVTYEWSDAQGNIHRSAPSLPISIVVPAGTSTNKNTITVSNLRVTYKVSPYPVYIVIYRTSVNQPIPYCVNSGSNLIVNNTRTNTATFVDTLIDSDIAGETILYTYGGEVENIGPPACKSATIYKSRMFIIPSEYPNQIWFSKSVLQNTPVEFSDVLTIYTGPVISGQDVAGDNVTITSMDDKIILGKSNGAFCYLYGNGPDNTGANNDFSEPLPITSPVGCTNQLSIVPIPTGLMFESEGNGIWILRRDLITMFIGADVDDYKDRQVVTSINIPRQNEVRFSLDDGTILVYDYFYNQWTTFEDNKAICTENINGLQTLLLADGTVRQETLGSYHDAGKAVYMKFQTGWINAAGIQGFQRAYYMYILANYQSPHKLYVQIAYDYNPSPVQAELITPIQQNLVYGEDPVWGSSSPWGGDGTVEQWRVFFQRQKCQSFQITVTEVPYPGLAYDPGAGLTISSLNIVVGIKSGYARLRTGASTQTG